ncbi:MAG TPA: Do family serine endopeptidase [Roseiarcus sp.]|nr:Do family serine endopeptidase [Roseiarcus sp.]
MRLLNGPCFSSRNLRAGLLGAVVLAVLGGLTLEGLPLTSYPAVAETQTLQAGPASFADVVDRVKDAVVSVKVKMNEDEGTSQFHVPDVTPGSPLDRFFRQFGQIDPFGDQDEDGSTQRMPHHRHLQMAQGSGFFISADGYVVTNNHVVNHATEVTVTTIDGKTVPAKVIGTDAKTDLALLKVKEGGDYPFVKFAAKSPRVGDWVLAVGNPFGLGGTVTAGIVSARGRDIGSGPYDDFLQIDAPVNRGNSGGPSFNSQGEVVGVNTAIFSPSGGSVGIGFAIASDVAQSVIQQLKDNGAVARGWLGVEIQPVSEDIADSLGLKQTEGALVAKDQKDSPAMAAGIKAGDVITKVNGETVVDPRDLARKIAALGPKKSVDLTIMRNGQTQTVTLTLGQLPNDKQEASNETTDDAGKSEFAKLGMTLAPVGRGKEGVVVTDIEPDGAAAQKGLEQGDIILDAGGKPVSRPGDITAAFEAAKSEGRKAVLLRVKSGDDVHFVAISTQAAS